MCCQYAFLNLPLDSKQFSIGVNCKPFLIMYFMNIQHSATCIIGINVTETMHTSEDLLKDLQAVE